MNSPCPPAAALERLLANELGHGEEQTLETHVAECAACRRRLDELTHLAGPIPSRPGARENPTEPAARGGVITRLADPPRERVRVVEARPASEGARNDSLARKLGGAKKMRATGRFLRRQVWIWPLVAALLVGGVGWWVNRSVESALRRQRTEDLKVYLEADVQALRGWMDNQRVLAGLVANDEKLASLVQELLAISAESPDSRANLVRAQAHAAIQSRLAEPLQKGRYAGFEVVSPSGVVLSADSNGSVGATHAGIGREFFASVCGGKTNVSKPFISPLLLADEQGQLRAGLPCMYAAALIFDEAGRPLAALGLRIRPDDQFTTILQAARPGRSGETYAFDRQGVLLSQSRFDDQLKRVGLLVDRADSRSLLNVEVRDPGVNMVAGKRPAAPREEQPLTHMAASAVRGIDGTDADGYRDYRGVPVVGAWQWLEDFDLGIATEIDADEAFAPAGIFRRAFALLMALLVAAAVAILLAMLFMDRQQRRLLLATRAAQQFGQYTLVEQLGTGGMGTVYKARHAMLRRPTAVKLLNPEAVSDSAVARFEREVQLTSELTHPNTVTIYDYGRTEQGVFYYAMEYLDGVNLEELVRREGPLSEERVQNILRQVCASLGEAHAAGLIHRDVKPANIVLTTRGGRQDFVKVLDFGLAKSVFEQREAGLTSSNTIAGTPLYVAPETILRPEKVDARADVYAIGALGCFLLTGEPVFGGSSAADICLKHINEAPTPPSVVRGAAVSPAFEAILLRCLAKSPQDRPNDANDLLRLLERSSRAENWPVDEAAISPAV